MKLARLSRAQRAELLCAAAVATEVNWLGWLGWHRRSTRGADGYLHGPYHPWQVVGLIVVLGLIAAVLGRANKAVLGAGIVTVVMTLSFASDATAHPEDNDGLWPFGAYLLALGTYGGVCAVAVVAGSIGRQASAMRWRPPPGWPAPPPGWTPPAGWQPDPSWPAAPCDHEWWS
jgi:hypothetical protein